jgi:uncharacterized protein
MQNKERVRAGMVALNTRRQTATGNYGAHDITRDELRQWFVDNGYVELDGGKFPKGEREAINNEEAARWYRLSAEQGIADASFSLALMYDEGRGVTQDDKESVKWFRLSAEQGDAMAQVFIGSMYEGGEAMTQNYNEAIKWYRLSAEQGNATAQLNLGVMYAKGQGVTQDDVYAHMWWNIAAEGGNSRAQENRDKVATRMTSSQLEEARRLARECVAKDYKGC